jgi:hypothetical protein
MRAGIVPDMSRHHAGVHLCKNAVTGLVMAGASFLLLQVVTTLVASVDVNATGQSARPAAAHVVILITSASHVLFTVLAAASLMMFTVGAFMIITSKGAGGAQTALPRPEVIVSAEEPRFHAPEEEPVSMVSPVQELQTSLSKDDYLQQVYRGPGDH